MKRNFLPSPSKNAFTLVELLTVMLIIAIMVGLGAAAFKGGSNSDATKSTSVIASALFASARNEAIMRQTPCRVIVDTAYNAARPEIFLRRLTVAYLKVDPTGVTVDPTVATNWLQADKWTVLPANNYFDPTFSAPHGTMEITFAGFGGASTGYAYYEIQANGLAVNPKPTLAQFVVSPGRVDPSGTFTERDANSRYGFVLFRMGRTTFFQSSSDIAKPSGT